MTMQWDKPTRIVVLCVCLALTGWFVYLIRPIIAPIIIAALLAYLLSPLVKVVQTRLRLRRGFAVTLVYFFSLAMLFVIPSVLMPEAVEQAGGLYDDLVKMEAQLEIFLTKPIAVMGQELHLGQMLVDVLKRVNQSLIPTAEGAMVVLETTSASLVWLLIILISVYYFLINGESLRNWFVGLAPRTLQPDVWRLLAEVDALWQAYLRGTLLLMNIVGIVFSVVWMAVGLPGALILGILAGLLTVIPDLGPAIVAIVAVAVALFKGSNFLPLSNFSFALLVFVIYFVLIQIKSIWLRPRIMGHFLHLNEGLVFVAILGAAFLWGILGALVIVPVIATISVIGHYLWCRILGLNPWPETPDAITNAS